LQVHLAITTTKKNKKKHLLS